MDELDSLERAKKELREQGQPVLMHTKYCEDFTKRYGRCDKCEYEFACMDILKLELKYSVEMILDQLIENGERFGDINSEECSVHRLVGNSCDKCESYDQCYAYALKILRKIKGMDESEKW